MFTTRLFYLKLNLKQITSGVFFFIKQSSMLNCFKLKKKHAYSPDQTAALFQKPKGNIFSFVFLIIPCTVSTCPFHQVSLTAYFPRLSAPPSFLLGWTNKQTVYPLGASQRYHLHVILSEAGRICTDAYSWQHVHEGRCGRQSGSFLQTVQRSMGLECRYAVFLFITALEHREQ